MSKPVNRGVETPIVMSYPTSDYLCPNLPRDTVEFRVHVWYNVKSSDNGMIRISVSGADDTGMERDEHLPVGQPYRTPGYPQNEVVMPSKRVSKSINWRKIIGIVSSALLVAAMTTAVIWSIGWAGVALVASFVLLGLSVWGLSECL